MSTPPVLKLPWRPAPVSLLLSVITAWLAWPTLSIWAAWLQWDATQAGLITEMLQTVLPRYAWTSLLVCAGVACGVVALGAGTATLVCLFDFPGRRWLQWALLLPLAMPAYVVAYAYTDFLQYSGPLQVWLRATMGWQGALWPDVRSAWGAILIFTLTLYPYVYLLVRTALNEQAAQLLDAARLLGASRWRQIRTVALPMARPAIAAGTALALMETLADYGVSSYFGIQTFTAGIYKAWLSMDNPLVAGQLATVLLGVVMVLLHLERRAQQRMRYASARGARNLRARQTACTGLRGGALLVLGLAPVLLGFVLPSLMLLHSWLADPLPVPWARFAGWGLNSLRLAATAAVLAFVLAVVLAAANRLTPNPWSRSMARVIGMGYAIPGAVVVVGILLPLGLLQGLAPTDTLTWLVTGTSAGLLWAYLVRFSAVAMQSIDSGYSRIPAALDESSRMLGVRGWALMRQLHLPLLRRSGLAALLLVFVDVMKELPATLVLRPFNSDTLAVVTYQLARDERPGEAALPALALVLVGLIPILLLSRGMDRENSTY
ncbi:MAG: ABC transporter permease [Limnohabitans sp.]